MLSQPFRVVPDDDALAVYAHRDLRIEDLGEAYFDQRQRQHVSRRLKQRLERLGYRVQLEPLTSAA